MPARGKAAVMAVASISHEGVSSVTENVSTYPAAPPPDRSTADLIAAMSQQTSRLIRDELLAQLDVKEKVKKAGHRLPRSRT